MSANALLASHNYWQHCVCDVSIGKAAEVTQPRAPLTSALRPLQRASAVHKATDSVGLAGASLVVPAVTVFILRAGVTGMPCTTSGSFVTTSTSYVDSTLGWVSVSVLRFFAYLKLFSNLPSISAIGPVTGASQEHKSTITVPPLFFSAWANALLGPSSARSASARRCRVVALCK